MREEFLLAIEKDPYDLETRKVFADWLDEFGDDKDADLAQEQRLWTEEKQDSIVWLTNFARNLTGGYLRYEDNPPDDITYKELIEGAKKFQQTGEKFGIPFMPTNSIYPEDIFWRHFELATGMTASKQEDFIACCS